MFSRIHRALGVIVLLLSARLLAVDVAAAVAPPSLGGISGGGAVELGQTVSLDVRINMPSGSTAADYTYLWRTNGNSIPGATSRLYTIEAIMADDAGTYAATVTNSAGSSVATTALIVSPLRAPAITTQPVNRTTVVGQEVNFGFAATGSYPRTYQWRKDGTAIVGANSAGAGVGLAKLASISATSLRFA